MREESCYVMPAKYKGDCDPHLELATLEHPEGAEFGNLQLSILRIVCLLKTSVWSLSLCSGARAALHPQKAGCQSSCNHQREDQEDHGGPCRPPLPVSLHGPEQRFSSPAAARVLPAWVLPAPVEASSRCWQQRPQVQSSCWRGGAGVKARAGSGPATTSHCYTSQLFSESEAISSACTLVSMQLLCRQELLKTPRSANR